MDILWPRNIISKKSVSRIDITLTKFFLNLDSRVGEEEFPEDDQDEW
jgi:hypothetical protein